MVWITRLSRTINFQHRKCVKTNCNCLFTFKLSYINSESKFVIKNNNNNNKAMKPSIFSIFLSFKRGLVLNPLLCSFFTLSLVHLHFHALSVCCQAAWSPSPLSFQSTFNYCLDIFIWTSQAHQSQHDLLPQTYPPEWSTCLLNTILDLPPLHPSHTKSFQSYKWISNASSSV